MRECLKSIAEGVDDETDTLASDVKKELVAIPIGFERLGCDKAKDEVAEVGKELFGGDERGRVGKWRDLVWSVP